MILNLARPTPGDSEFYSRWTEVGPVYTPGEVVDRNSITVLVVDQHSNVKWDSVLANYPKIKYVCSATTGHTHLDYDFKGIKVLTLRGETEFLQNVRSVSEFTMGLILRLARPDNRIGTLLANKRLGIVGFGRIGKQLSVIASGFGMRVSHVDVNSNDGEWIRLFKYSDFISIHLPETPETKGKIDRTLLNLMKPSSFLINTARPSVLDESSLARLLWAHQISGAALDVTGMDWSDYHNVIVTPHIAGFTLEDRIKTDQFLVDKLKQEFPRRVKERSL